MFSLIVLDGLYPTNPLWQLPLLAIICFEIAVMIAEAILIVGNWDWMIKNKKRGVALVVLANLVTLGLGVAIQVALGGGVGKNVAVIAFLFGFAALAVVVFCLHVLSRMIEEDCNGFSD